MANNATIQDLTPSGDPFLAHDANIVATMLAYDIPCLLSHNVKDFERFGEMVRIEEI